MFYVDLKALAVGTEIQMLSFKWKPSFVVLVVLDYKFENESKEK